MFAKKTTMSMLEVPSFLLQSPSSLSLTSPMDPTMEDIFLGRGTLHAKHPGNSRFYRVIDGFLEPYDRASCKIEKTDIIKGIYDKVRASGQRFLKEDTPNCGVWSEAPEEEAKKKIGHTIRYRQKRQMTRSGSSSVSSQPSQARPTKTERQEKHLLPLVSPIPSPVPLRVKSKSPIQDIFSDDELESVLGFPGEMNISEEPSFFLGLPGHSHISEEPFSFVLKPSKKKIPLEELGLGLAAFGFAPF